MYKNRSKSTAIKLRYACSCMVRSLPFPAPPPQVSHFNIITVLVHAEGSSIPQHTYKLQVRKGKCFHYHHN